MRPLTDTTPKPLIKVGPQSLLDHTIDLVDQAGLAPAVVNAHYLADQIQSHLAHRDDIHVIVEDIILDTGGGLKNAADHLDGDVVITTNSDNIWAKENPFTTVTAGWQPHMPACLLCAHRDQVFGRQGPGDFDLHSDGRLSRGGDFVFLGVQVLDKQLALGVPEDVFSLNIVWDQLIEENALFGVQFNGTWCDVGRPENIELAASLVKTSHV